MYVLYPRKTLKGLAFMTVTHNCVPHGPMTCDRCWKTISASVQESGRFRLVRDPGHWGSANPSVLVLGISKGNTQSSAFRNGRFEDVAFKGIRNRLLLGLQVVGLLPGETLVRFEQRFLSGEQEYAFASVVRCSLTGFDKVKKIHTADSGNVVPAFKPGSAGYFWTSACVDQHIGHIPSATRTVILLGNSDNYMKHLRTLVSHTVGRVMPISEVAFRAGETLFVHVAHPSKGNGHFGAFISGKGASGAKMRLASAALGQSAL